MSEDTQRTVLSPVHLCWGSKPASDNENKENVKNSIKKLEGTKRLNLGPSMEVAEKVRKMYEPTGAIPKRFGEVNRINTNVNNQNIPHKNQADSGVFSKSRFSIFDENFEERAVKGIQDEKKLDAKFMSSSTMLDGNLNVARTKENFNIAKNFFVRQESIVKQSTEGKLKREFHRLPRLHSIEEASRKSPRPVLQLQRVKQIIEQHLEDGKDTPHDVPPPQPVKIKVLHNSIADRKQELTKYTRKVIAETTDRFQAYYPENVIIIEEEKDKCRRFRPNYRPLNASTDQRQTIIHFLLRICSHNALPSHLAYQVVRIFDDMLQARRIPLKNLQLVMIGSLWIVMKKDYIIARIPSAQEMANFSDGLYTDADVRRGEIQIMQTLNFQINYPEPFTMLTFFIITHKHADFMDEEQKETTYYFGSYMLDLVLLDEELMRTSPILLSATAAELALTLMMEPESTLHCTLFERWRSDYAYERHTDDDINNCRALLIRNITESCYRSSKSHVVHKKYKKSRYGRVAKKLIDKILKLLPQSIKIF